MKTFLRTFFFSSLFLILTGAVFAQTTFTSVQSGLWHQASTWTGTGTPGSGDIVVILNNHVVTNSKNEDVLNITINAGGELVSTKRLRTYGNYINNGTHSGTGNLLFLGANRNISGSGSITNTSTFDIRAAYTILAGSNLSFSGDLSCPNNLVLTNLGTITVAGDITGNPGGTFTNGANATLNIAGDFYSNGNVITTATGNTVNYNLSGNGIQDIRKVTSYYNLSVTGDNPAGTKRLVESTNVANDFSVTNNTFTQVDTITFRVGGDISLTNATYIAADALLVLNGSGNQSIDGGIRLNNVIIQNGGTVSLNDTITLSGQLDLQGGNLNSNGNLVVSSNASGDASIGPIAFGSSISGDVVNQRYIDQGTTNWRFMGSPTTDATFEDWRDDFIMSGFPGSQFPSFYFTSIYGYDETVGGHQDSGFYTISITDDITPGVGWWVYCGDSLEGTDPFTVDVTGPVNQGTFVFDLSYTISAGSVQDGWNLIANPYPSAINWDSPNWTKINVDNAIYIWNTDANQYSSYVAGVGTNGGSNIVPIGQGFYVKANLLLPQLVAQESVKYDTTVTFLREEPIDDLLVRMNLTQGSTSAQTAVRANQESTKDFDPMLEAYHFASLDPEAPALYSTGALDMSIQAVPVIERDTIMIDAKLQAGSALLSYELKEYDGAFCAAVVDLENGQHHLLGDTGSFVVTNATPGKHRLMLVIERMNAGSTECAALVGLEETPEQVSSLYHYNGQIYLQEPANNIPYTIYDAQGRVVKSGSMTGTTLDVSDLTPGFYYLDRGEDGLKFIAR